MTNFGALTVPAPSPRRNIISSSTPDYWSVKVT